MENKVNYSSRYIEIVHVMVKYGFQTWIMNSTLNHLIPNKVLEKHSDINKLPIEVRLRLAIEELGPTFIKLGQLLSNRADLIPIEYVHELQKLQDNVSEDNTLNIEEYIEKELGQSANEVFEYIDPNPIGIASIGQSYAVKRKGKNLVLKVRKVNADVIMNEDLRIMRSILRVIVKSSKSLSRMDTMRLFDEFEISIKNELNYAIERRNQAQFVKYFKDSKSTCAPNVVNDLSTQSLFCMDFAEGVKLKDFLKSATEKQKETVSKRLVKSFVQQIIEFGFYHADPHPGNIFITEDLRICFIDFGAVGHLLPEDTTLITEFLEAFLSKDTDRVIRAIKRIAVSHEITVENQKNLQYQLHDIFQELDQGVDEVPWVEFSEKIMAIMFHYNIVLPNYFVNLAKALSLVLGTALDMNPKMNILEEIKPFMIKYQFDLFSLKNQRKMLLDLFNSLKDVKTIPTDIKDIIQLIKRGKIEVQIGLDDTKTILDTFRNGINKLTTGIIIGCLLIASSSMSVSENASFVNNFALGGYFIAGILGLVLTIDMFKDLFKKNK
ncbi:ABC1 kinase family protein [Flammeovirga kamogawensis]|uniref:Protein kinase domain-containing protein n=1 Tax=Flammeovirga kamogawensis TaxID=373891 RepID=A0ABX8H1P6_9BACT|nr:AarF/UbiB family protein [Flammeovirga kamogawensis]MBB6463296.1 ubiquinone biosynthesis protein [Flammeovirga kamogawensis]QWG09554.1 hypothetical protein KM029_23385 [Flammeovirga kamogawensis]TRX65068.1 AarF/ABC1/UbiB kinase family protein [Flammeovirga kamogawensis]